MLTVSAMSSGQEEYYLEIAREDYFFDGGEPLGLWHGQGAKAFGRFGTVEKEQLRQFFEGYAPDGTRPIVQLKNWKDRKRQAGWDLTFSVPKSVSVLWSVAGADLRKQIQEAHLEAVRAALAYLEDVASFTRRGKGGHIVEKAKLVIATFEHGTSRALDPQLHTHCLVVNACVREDGTTGAILSKPLYQAKMAAGALYRAELSNQLEARLRLLLEREKTWFEVVGVPKPLMEESSKRRQQIKDALARYGAWSAKAAAIAALDTREVKGHVARSDLFAAWQKTGRAHGFTREQVLRLPVRQEPRMDTMTERAKAAVASALKRITEQHAHFAKNLSQN